MMIDRDTGRRGIAAFLLSLCLLVMAPALEAMGAAGPTTRSYTATLDGSIVHVELSGFEPDFDRIDRLVFSIGLRNGRYGASRLPDAMLVLSAYLENFQPDTTPTLPDLLHPDQTATNLGGFMQGKAALVNAAGRTVYRGSMLSEVFFDNSVHLVLDLQPVSGGSHVADLRMRGSFTLHKDLTVLGHLWSTGALSPTGVRALHVPRGHLPTWKAVANSMTVRLPPMMGTMGNRASVPATPTPVSAPRTVLSPVAMLPLPARIAASAGSAVVLLALMCLAIRRHRTGRALRASTHRARTEQGNEYLYGKPESHS